MYLRILGNVSLNSMSLREGWDSWDTKYGPMVGISKYGTKLQLPSKQTIPLEGRKITKSDRTLHFVSISCCSRTERGSVEA
jgi:hypothetical protein